jgi:hypothetical protein
MYIHEELMTINPICSDIITKNAGNILNILVSWHYLLYVLGLIYNLNTLRFRIDHQIPLADASCVEGVLHYKVN